MSETFTLAEFTTDAWRDRPEYRASGVDWDHVLKLHGSAVETGKLGDTDVYYFMHQEPGSARCEFWLWCAHAWNVNGEPAEGHPVAVMCVKTYEGFTEWSGAQTVTCEPVTVARAFVALHELCCAKWKSFAEWYA